MAELRRTSGGYQRGFQPAPGYQAGPLSSLDTPALIRDVLFRAGEPINQVSDFYDQTVGYLNRAEITLAAGGQEFEPTVQEAWRWHRSPYPGVLIFIPPWETTITATQGSLIATLNDPPERDVTGEMFVSDQPAWPEVINFGGETLTWDAPWVGPTGTYKGAFWKLNYYLMPDVLRILDPMRILLSSGASRNYELSGMDRLQMDRHWPPRTVQPGIPEAYAVIAARVLRINRPVKEYTRVEYDFMITPPVLYDSAESVPKEPVEYRYTLADMALYYLFCDKDDNRRDNVGTQARGRIISMRDRERAIQAQIASSYGRLYTRPSSMGPR